MTIPNFSTPLTSIGTHFALGLIPLFLKVGLFFVVLATIRIAWEFVIGLIFGMPDGAPEGAVYGEWSRAGHLCPMCGMKHGPHYKGTHPLTE